MYLDNIVVYGNTLEQHLQRVDEVLGKIKESRLKPKLGKESVNFLGHVVSKDGVLPSADNVAKIFQWPCPESVTGVRQFRGMASYYRRFIKDFSSIASQLEKITKKESNFVWDSQCENPFRTLKQILTGPEIMAYPRDDDDLF